MNSTTAPKGLRPSEYNALLHAIWRFDATIRELKQSGDTDFAEALQQDRDGLQAIFVRLA